MSNPPMSRKKCLCSWDLVGKISGEIFLGTGYNSSASSSSSSSSESVSLNLECKIRNHVTFREDKIVRFSYSQ